MSVTIHLLKRSYISIVHGLVIGALIFSPLPFKQEINTLTTTEAPIVVPEALLNIAKGTISIPEFPDYRYHYQLTVVEPAQKAEEARIEAERLEAERVASLYVPAPVVAYTAPTQYAVGIGTLTGSYGYARAGGNCVDEPGVNSPFNGTNPISWPVLFSQPHIGATVLFWYNHTGVITGLWSNGDIEIRHQNWNGVAVTRFPRSTFRGYR